LNALKADVLLKLLCSGFALVARGYSCVIPREKGVPTSRPRDHTEGALKHNDEER
jgi:hypothetical protein